MQIVSDSDARDRRSMRVNENHVAFVPEHFEVNLFDSPLTMATTSNVAVMMDRSVRNLSIPTMGDREHREPVQGIHASSRLTRTVEVHLRSSGRDRLNDTKWWALR